jgi:recombination associated protein RdgC
MFSNAIIYKLAEMPDGGIIAAEEAMKADEFHPCGSTQEKSVGWAPPRGQEYGAFIETVQGHHIARLVIETKSVPASELTKAVDAHCAQIEATTGRKPGKKERREIKDDAKLKLLPQAFPKRKEVNVWIDTKASRVVIDTASQGIADDVVTQLVRIGFTLLMINTVLSAGTFMYNTLLGNEDDNFTLGRECELQAFDESKARATFKNHPLDGDDVCAHIKQGKSVTKLGLCFDNGSFLLTEGAALKKIDLNVPDDMGGQDADAFDADFFIASSLLGGLIDNLIESMGGELVIEEDA